MLERDRQSAVAAYYGKKDFTDYIIPRIRKQLKGYGLQTQKEYFRIDAIGWEPLADTVEETPGVLLKKHLWNLAVAVEHENASDDWMDEVVKLAHVCCPLRVVIGYLPWSKRHEDQRFDLLNLAHVSRALEKLDCRENLRRGEFLVILGNSGTGGDVSRYFGYRGYLYQNGGFVPLEEGV